MVFSVSRRQYFLDTDRTTGAYIVFYQDVSIDSCTHVSGQFSQSSAEIYYNASCTAGMPLSHFRILNIVLMKNDPDVIPEQAFVIIFYSNPPVYIYD